MRIGIIIGDQFLAEMSNKLNDVMFKLSHSNIPFKDIVSVVDELREQGYTDETIIDELNELKENLINEQQS